MGLRSTLIKALGGGQDRARAGGGTIVPMEIHTQAPPPSGTEVQGWFGPGDVPTPSAPAEVAGRRMDYPVGVNMAQRPRPYEAVGFVELRALADGYDLLRLVIETRKDQLARLQFNFSPRDEKQKVTPGSEIAARAQVYTDLFRRPDRDAFWGDWLRNVMEDLLVIDAPAIHIRRTLGGEIYSLDQIDGATIKRIVDDGGRSPEPPFAAYQQVLKGIPAVNYSRNDLIYRPRNLRVNKLYGFSPVEQVIMTVNIALRRQMWQLAYFTHGNIPDSLIGVPASWTPDQIRQFQDWFDSMLQGNTQERRSARFVPGEVAKSYVPTKEAEIFGVAEEWMARVICFCFGISHQALVKEVNRATAETAKEQAITDGMAPIMNWIKGLVDSILIDHYGETELEFSWVDDKELDPRVQSEIHTAQFGRIKSINEIREDLGLDPDPSPVCSVLGTITADGTFVPIDPTLALEYKKQAMEAFTGLGLGPDGKPIPAPEVDENEKKPSAGVAATAGGGSDDGDASDAAKLASSVLEKARTAVPRVSPLRPAAARIRRSLASTISEALEATAASVSAQVLSLLTESGVQKVDLASLSDEEIDALLERLMGDLDLSSMDVLIDATREDLEAIGHDTGRVVLGQLGVSSDADLVDRVSHRAVAYAEVRSAELVGRRVLADGTIIDNPDARWAIDETTRVMVRDTIAGGLRDNIGSDAIIEALTSSYAFSDERAEMISRTEIAMANSDSAMVAYEEARDAGVSLKKEWILGPSPCDVCQENAAAGALELEDEFPSGDQNTPAHPNCECAVIAIVETDDGGHTEEDISE